MTVCVSWDISNKNFHERRKAKMFDWIDEFIEATGCDWETAAREYDYYHNPDYDPEDYE